MIPSEKWVNDLIKLTGMPDHILRHSIVVSRVSLAIASKLPGIVDMVKIHRASLLHDICKSLSIGTGSDHAAMAGRLLDELGCPEIAWIVRQHVRLQSMDLNEAMIVNYSDKRVMHDRVVSLSRRFVDLMNRYGRDDARRERILELYSKSLETEKIILDATGIDPETVDNLNLMHQQYFFN